MGCLAYDPILMLSLSKHEDAPPPPPQISA